MANVSGNTDVSISTSRCLLARTPRDARRPIIERRFRGRMARIPEPEAARLRIEERSSSLDRIAVDPARMNGMACIRDLRVTVTLVSGQLASGQHGSRFWLTTRIGLKTSPLDSSSGLRGSASERSR